MSSTVMVEVQCILNIISLTLPEQGIIIAFCSFTPLVCSSGGPTRGIKCSVVPAASFQLAAITCSCFPLIVPVDIMSHLIDKPVLEIIEEPLVTFLVENN